jgi:hypothetical protein
VGDVRGQNSVADAKRERVAMIRKSHRVTDYIRERKIRRPENVETSARSKLKPPPRNTKKRVQYFKRQ